MSRRGLLCGASAFPLPFGSIPTSAMVWPSQASAEIGSGTMLAISLSIQAIRAIAEAGRGDNGVNASLSAIQDKLDLAVVEIAYLRQGIARLMDLVRDLPDVISEELGEQEAICQSDELLAAVDRIRDFDREAECWRRSLVPDSGSRPVS